MGGPTWDVLLGRLDSPTASRRLTNSKLLAPTSSLSTLITSFGNKGLSATDTTALSGAHTFGFAQCEDFRARIYNDNNINGQFAKQRLGGCPATSGSGDANLAPLDVTTQDAFDNAFYTRTWSRRRDCCTRTRSSTTADRRTRWCGSTPATTGPLLRRFRHRNCRPDQGQLQGG
jgi:peroxidase